MAIKQTKKQMTLAFAHHIKSVRYSLEKMAELGFSEHRCLANTGIVKSDVDNPEASITLEQELRFVQNILEISDDPMIGLQLGQAYPPQTFGIMGYAMISAPSFGHSLAVAATYGDLTYTMFRLVLEEVGDKGRFCFDPKSQLPPDILQLFLDRDTSSAKLCFDTVLGRPLKLERVCLAHNSSQQQRYEEFFGCPVQTGQPRTFLEFPREEMNIALPKRDMQSSDMCIQQCQMLIAKLSKQSGFVDEVRQFILSEPGVFPSLERLSERLKMSPRTLRRRLSEEGTSYQQILDEIRFRLAKQYLQETRITLEEISELLGYSDPGNFSHAFKRWSQTSPRQWRKQHAET